MKWDDVPEQVRHVVMCTLADAHIEAARLVIGIADAACAHTDTEVYGERLSNARAAAEAYAAAYKHLRGAR